MDQLQVKRKTNANSHDIIKSEKMLTEEHEKPISEDDEFVEPNKKKIKLLPTRKSDRNQSKKRKRYNISSNEESSASEEETFCEWPERSNPRRTAATKVSYKYSDCSDTEDISDVDDEYQSNSAAEPGSEAKIIDKVLAQRRGKIGVVGPSTTIYAVEENGDPNEGCDPNDLLKTEIQFLIKWKGYSYVHSTWESRTSMEAEKVDTRSMKKIQDFLNKEEDVAHLKTRASPEETEYFDYEGGLQKSLIDSYYIVDRIIATDNQESYLVKWQSLPYAEATWEDAAFMERKWPDRIREYREREDSKKTPSKMCKALKYRPKFELLTEQPAYLAGGNPDINLRDYQLHGVNWLIHSWCKENSVILADEMGLGKTIQIISFLYYLFHEHQVHGPFLVVVPLSTMTSWQREFSIWAPDMNVVSYIGDATSRKLIRQHEWCFANTHRPKFNVILTTYEILIIDKAILGSLHWAELMVDEAHRLKNDNSLLYTVLSGFNSYHRVLITGTPLQNVLKELWALLHFIMPSEFSSWEEFEEDHADATNEGFTSLHKVLEPFLLRRVKKDVEKSLPAKVEQILRVEMTSNQKKFYRLILTKNFTALRKELKGSTASFLNVIMQLKKCCNHSFLIELPDSEVIHQASPEERLQQLIRGSGKLLLLDKLLTRLRETGHRVLIFSQMVRMLDILAEYLEARRFPFQQLDGGSRGEIRKLALDHFNAENSQDFCFLLSTRAGGLGINLASADTVIIFDSDWNPQNDLQAQARAHRIGQTKQVNVYRLVTKNSVEEEIIQRAKKKMVLDHLIIQRMDTTGRTVLDSKAAGSAAVPFNKDELTAILKFGAANLFKNDGVEDEEPVCDIDEILRRAETREEEAPATMGDELLSAFKMANFVMTEEEYKSPHQNEHEDDPANEEADWDEIIPENFRARLEQEQKAKELVDAYLPPKRIRKTIQNFNKLDSDDSSESDDGEKKDKANVSIESANSEKYESGDDESDDESDDEDSDVPRVPIKAPKTTGHPFEGFLVYEIRSFVQSFQKFPAPMTRLEAIARDAKLQHKSKAALQKLAEYMHERCITESEKTDVPMINLSFRIRTVVVNAQKILRAEKHLEPLDKMLPANIEERSSWTLQAEVKCAARYTDVDWNIEDDSKLLRGIYEYGLGSWEAIKNDPSLGLGEKILRPEGKPPGPKELKNRALYLIKILRDEMSKNSAKVNSGSSP